MNVENALEVLGAGSPLYRHTNNLSECAFFFTHLVHSVVSEYAHT